MLALRVGFGFALLWAALDAQPLLAQARDSGAPSEALSGATIRATVVLVMESGGGVKAATELRASLNRRPNVHLVSLAEASHAPLPPTAVLTVATDPTRVVSVFYWDLAGNTESLTAPTPADAAQISAVVLALASALLERHRPELDTQGAGIEAAPAAPALDWMRTSRALYAMLGRLGGVKPRTDVQLRAEDF